MTGDVATQGLQVYIVGGAVRDALLGLTPDQVRKQRAERFYAIGQTGVA